MVVTLEMLQTDVEDDINFNVVDELRRDNWLLDHVEIDDIVSIGGRGATPTFTWTILETPAGAAYRALNTEFVPSEAKKTRQSVDLQILGNSFQIDRVSAMIGNGAEVAFQMVEHIKSAGNFVCDQLINGQGAVKLGTKRAASPFQATGFVGLSALLAGTVTEITDDVPDLTGVNSQQTAYAAMRGFDRLIRAVRGRVDAIVLNEDAIGAVENMARYSTSLSTTDAYGQTVTTYKGIPLVDPGFVTATDGSEMPIVRLKADGTTDIYAVRFSLDDGVGMVGLDGYPPVKAWLPDFTTAGAVKSAEAEMVLAPVLKSRRGAAVLRGVKVAAAGGGTANVTQVPSGQSTSTDPTA